MLGEKLGEEHGKVTTRRILPGDDYRYIKMEVTFEAAATFAGVEGRNIGTYVIWERVPGQIYAEGQGIFMGNSGESAIWNGHGVGQGGPNGISVAASVAFQAGEGSLARLNNVLVLVEHTTDNDDNANSTLYEWKGA